MGWVGKVLKGHRATALLGLEESLKIIEQQDGLEGSLKAIEL